LCIDKLIANSGGYGRPEVFAESGGGADGGEGAGP